MASLCPITRTPGKRVTPVTLRSLVRENRLPDTEGREWFYCPEPDCDVVYFAPDGATLARTALKVRVGAKEHDPPRTVCYCFGHTLEGIEADVKRCGTSHIADEITEHCRRGLDRCEETNPKGSCCLGDVRRAIQDAQAKQDRLAETDSVPSAAKGEDCCAAGAGPKPAATSRAATSGLWATGGAVLSAVLSSACCWLPLLLLAFGVSAAGVSGFFETYRPYLLAATATLLASGFYLVYFRAPHCAPGEACAVPSSKLIRLNKLMLWIATGAVVAFAFFPNYVGHLLGGGSATTGASAIVDGESRRYAIEGMTCEACAVNLGSQLAHLPGVARADVSFAEKTARIYVASPGERVSDATILEAIREAGYRGAPVESGVPPSTP